MKKFLVALTVLTFVLGVMGMANVYALDIVDITIWDKMGSGDGWYGTQEDDEVEPGCVTAQEWDLEAFSLTPAGVLTMVGGYDFKDGYGVFQSGDIFINYQDPTPPIYGEPVGPGGEQTILNSFGWDYALHMDFSSGNPTWSLYALNSQTTMLKTVFYDSNNESNPWRLAEYGTAVATGAFTFYDAFTDPLLGYKGTTHYAVEFDLDAVFAFDGGYKASDYNYFKFTMECGNDNLVGRDPIPEPTTLLLLGSGLIGLVAFGRKLKK